MAKKPTPKSPQRADVYKAIDGERDHQDITHPKAADLGTLLVLMDVYFMKAKYSMADPLPRRETQVLNQIRKIAALAVQAMETHGIVER